MSVFAVGTAVAFESHSLCPDPAVDLSKLITSIKNAPTKKDFLKVIKANNALFSTFTFVRKSASPLAAGINDKFPGPILMSRDGSMEIRWSCDPKSSVYGLVELFQFNNKKAPDGPYETMNLNYQNGKKEYNSKSCLSCHATVPESEVKNKDFLPIWRSYPTWRSPWNLPHKFAGRR